jgi:hypothetical protein
MMCSGSRAGIVAVANDSGAHMTARGGPFIDIRSGGSMGG